MRVFARKLNRVGGLFVAVKLKMQLLLTIIQELITQIVCYNLIVI